MKGFAINASMVGSLSAFVAAGSASAAFVGFFVSAADVTHQGHDLKVYTLTARFDGAADTVERAFNLTSLTADGLTGYWHKDNSSAEDSQGTLSQDFGSWDPTQCGSPELNRPYDSYLTVGGIARVANTSASDASWFTGGNADERGWARPDLPDNGVLAWLNDTPANAQGRVGNSIYVPSTDVRLGQFVLSAGHTFRELGLSIAYTDGMGGSMQFASGSFTFGTVPTPGAIALLTMATFVVSRRRR